MPGYPGYPGFDIALGNALYDLKAFETGGMDMIIIENNYDIPHKEKILADAFNEMVSLGKRIRENTDIPIGVSVLWNDYENALKIAKEINGSFIRVPVFVDRVKTSYGIMEPKAEEVVRFRSALEAQDIKIYADIHVKHSEILSKYTIQESAQLAIDRGADALIVTGKWTGDSPDLDDLVKVREVVGDFPIICGSGVDIKNIKELLTIADGAIISTSLKENTDIQHERNIKPYEVRISLNKVMELVKQVRTSSIGGPHF